MALALVPEFRLVTGKFPVTPVVKGKPMAFVNVPDEGVPRAPLNTTKDPAEPTFIPSAVATPVPSEDMPVPPREGES